MAELARTALVMVGSAYGGPLGAIAGSLVGGLLFPEKLPDIEGPRLKDRRVTSSTLGSPINNVYGTYRVNGNIIWSGGIVETAHERSVGGKGGPTQVETSYTYDVSFAVALCEGEVAGVRRIWADGKIIYDVGASATATQVLVSNQSGVTIYSGTETQAPDATIQATIGLDDTPANRGICYLVFSQLQLELYGNRLPSITAEVMGEGTLTDTLIDPLFSYSGHDRFEGTTYFDGGHFYRYEATRAEDGLSFDVAEERWSIDGNKVGFTGRTYTTELVIAATDNGVLIDTDTAGYMLKSSTTATGLVLAYFEYDGPLISEIILGDTSGNIATIIAAKSGLHFYFAFTVASDSNKYFRYGLNSWTAVDVGWPDTVTPGTITDEPSAIAADATYLYAACVDSVEGSVLVRYALSYPLVPVDYITIDEAGNPFPLGFSAKDGVLKSFRSNQTIYTYPSWGQTLETAVSTIPATYASGAAFEPFHIWWSDGLVAIWNDDRTTLGELGVEYTILSPSAVTLASVASAISAEVGLAPAAIDVSGLTETVAGYIKDGPMTGRAALEPLLDGYNVVGFEQDWKIVFMTRAASVEAIDEGDFVQPKVKLIRQGDNKLPRRVTAQYADAARDYIIATQMAQRVN